MKDENRINPNHSSARKIIRNLGVAFVLVGGSCFLVGLISFFMSFGSNEFPKLFFLMFIGLPVFGSGTMLCMVGFMGAMARYQSAEVAPVAKDTFNYVASETQPGVKSIAQAVGAGLSEGLTGAGQVEGTRQCLSCDTQNDATAHFCDACGAALPHAKYCLNCGTENDSDAQYCDHCGSECE